MFALYVSVFIYILIDLYTNSHTSSTPVELYEISHRFYVWIILTHTLWTSIGYNLYMFGWILQIVFFLNLQVKTFKSSCYSSYVWIKMVKKVTFTSPIAFNHFAGHLWGCVTLFVAFSFIYINLELFFFYRWGWLILLGWVVSYWIYLYLWWMLFHL